MLLCSVEMFLTSLCGIPEKDAQMCVPRNESNNQYKMTGAQKKTTELKYESLSSEESDGSFVISDQNAN